ncbi:MAG: Smr/MutS family protein [Sphingomonadales bacterium]
MTRDRRLSPDDARLWRHVTRSVAPLARNQAEDRNRAHRTTLMDSTMAAHPHSYPTPDPKPETTRPKTAPKTPLNAPMPEPAARSPQRTGETISDGPANRQWARRMTRGDMAIDARLDLHGLTQNEAHDRLLRFLNGAVAQRLRVLLVITGKGSRTGDRPAPGEPSAGVLRRSFKGWVRSSAVSAHVMSIEPAHRSHGGGGAWYVILRRPQDGRRDGR